jgi:acetyl esterase
MKTAKSLHALGWILFISLSGPIAQAQRERPPLPEPTYANVSYGEHPNQVIDFWKADIPGRGPLAVFIHGGGFRGGSKDSLATAKVNALRNAGIHVASVEYRFLKHAKLPAAHDDAIRAIQFIRSKSREWGIDKEAIGAFGGSAGAQLVAYLAWHDDMADPDSEDPIARESTRLACVAPLSGQASMDFNWWFANIPGYDNPHREISGPRNSL